MSYKINPRDNYYMLNWLDEYMIGHKGFICGGCFKNIFNKEKVKDLDIFFKSKGDWQDAVNYFDSMTEGYNGEDARMVEYRYLYSSPKVKAYVNIETGIRIELCCSIFGTPQEILDQFDFTITKFAYFKEEVHNATIKDELEKAITIVSEDEMIIEYKVMFHEDFFEHLHEHRLVCDDKIPFPASTFERSYKYARYGYFPCKETKMKMIKALHDMDDRQIELSESLYDGMD